MNQSSQNNMDTALALAPEALEDNKRTACLFIDSLRDLSGFTSAALMSDSATWQVMARSRSLPLGEALTKDQFCSMVRTMKAVFPNGVEHHIKTLTAEADRVAIETESYAELPGGRIYRNVYHFMLRIHGGKVNSAQEYTDLLYAKEVIFDHLPIALGSPEPL